MKSLKLEEFTRYKFLSGIELSPKGKHAGFVVHESNLDDNNYNSNLWLYNLKSEELTQLTALDKESNFIWLEDGDSIIFPTVRDEKDKKKLESGESFTQFYKININGGEAQKFFKIDKRVTSIKQMDRSNFVFAGIFDHNEEDLSSLNEEEKAKKLKKKKEEKDYQVIEEIPFWSNGGGFTNKKRNRLYIYDLNTNEYKAISEATHSVNTYIVSPNKSKILFTTQSFEGVVSLSTGIYLYDIATQSTKTLLQEGEYACGYTDFIDDGSIVFVGTKREVYGMNENRKFFQLDIESGEVTCLTPELDAGLYNSVGSDCRYGGSTSFKVEGGNLYFVTTEGENSYLNKLTIKDKIINKITHGEGSIDGFDVIGGDIVFIGLRGLKLQELYSLEDQEKQITNFNQWVMDEIKLSIPEALTFKNSDGIIIDGWVLKPVDFDDNNKYPAILNIHGGPKTVYGTVFYHEMQYWANEGYFVFFCNPRGSDGKGNEFADIRGKYGTVDYDDLMQFTDEVLAKYPSIDQDRVGVTGGSYGGFMTNWIIGHTHRFKAAASQRSISNWISKFGTTDIGFFFVDDQQGGTPWNNVEKLWWHSPMRYADKVKTPTLFIHSDEDYRCWTPEAYQMFTSIKYHGVEARMCIFKGENHELSRSGKPKHRIRRLEEITNWFNRYLK